MVNLIFRNIWSVEDYEKGWPEAVGLGKIRFSISYRWVGCTLRYTNYRRKKSNTSRWKRKTDILLVVRNFVSAGLAACDCPSWVTCQQSQPRKEKKAVRTFSHLHFKALWAAGTSLWAVKGLLRIFCSWQIAEQPSHRLHGTPHDNFQLFQQRFARCDDGTVTRIRTIEWPSSKFFQRLHSHYPKFSLKFWSTPSSWQSADELHHLHISDD